MSSRSYGGRLDGDGGGGEERLKSIADSTVRVGGEGRRQSAGP